MAVAVVAAGVVVIVVGLAEVVVMVVGMAEVVVVAVVEVVVSRIDIS